MPSGFLSGGSCYESAGEAADNYFSTFPVLATQDQFGTVLTTKYIFQSPNWYKSVNYSNAYGGTVPVLSLAVPPAFPSCVPPSESFVDGNILGAAILAVSCSVWCIVQLKRIIR